MSNCSRSILAVTRPGFFTPMFSTFPILFIVPSIALRGV